MGSQGHVQASPQSSPNPLQNSRNQMGSPMMAYMRGQLSQPMMSHMQRSMGSQGNQGQGKGGTTPPQRGMSPQMGMQRHPMKTFGMMNPGQGQGMSQGGGGGHYQGAGAMVPVPGMGQGMGATPMNFQPIPVPQEMFQNASNMGQEQIGRSTRMGLQDIGRQFGARGLGRSGLMGLAAGGVMRGAQEQSANLGRELQNQRLNMEFGEQQNVRNMILPAREQALRESLGLGGLGIQQRQQQLAERGAYDKYRDQPSNMFGSLLQALTAAGGKS